MHTIDQLERLKAENERLKRKLKRANNRTKLLLDTLLTLDSDVTSNNYEMYMEINYDYHISFLKAILVVQELVKFNREDIGTVYLDELISRGNMLEVGAASKVEKSIRNLLKSIIKKGRLNRERLNIIVMMVASSEKKVAINNMENILNDVKDDLLNLCFKGKEDDTAYTIISALADSVYRNSFLSYLEYLVERWIQVYDCIPITSVNSWLVLARHAESAELEKRLHVILSRRVDAELFNMEGMISLYQGKNYEKSTEWKEVSELRTFGYEVSKKTDSERQVALMTAIKFIPYDEVVRFIQYRLKNAIKSNGKQRNFSNAIRAYEMDLDLLYDSIYSY